MEASESPVNLLFIFLTWVLGLFCLALGANLFGSGYWLGFLPLVFAGVLFVIGARWTRIALTTRAPFPPHVQEDPLPGGIALDAEVLGRYEAGAPAGSEDAKRRQPMMSSWDPLELELRYSFEGREIVSRRKVSVETFFHTRGMTTLRIKIRPERPEAWVAYFRA